MKDKFQVSYFHDLDRSPHSFDFYDQALISNENLAALRATYLQIRFMQFEGSIFASSEVSIRIHAETTTNDSDEFKGVLVKVYRCPGIVKVDEKEVFRGVLITE